MSVLLPDNQKDLLRVSIDLVETCRASAGIRAAYCRQINSIVETGKQDGSRSLINLLYRNLDRTAAHLFSPTDLRFAIDYEMIYPQAWVDRGKQVGRVLTRDFERSNTDMLFAQGVYEGLKYGAAVLKQWPQQEGSDRTPVYHRALLMPWQFGVYREDVNDIARQSAMCETTLLSLPEVWRRIHHLPNATDLFARIKTHAQTSDSSDEFNSYFHQILSTATLDTSATGVGRPQPGGIVQLGNDPNYSIIGPQITAPLIKFHELWVQGDEDYVTVQIVEPDILIAPLFKRANLLIGGDTHSGLQPYTLIQPNPVSGYFWGRSEITDLIEPQGMLSQWSDDVKRLFGLQIDKILGFAGSDNITDELYDQFRNTGYVNLGPGGSVNDLTPAFPPNALQMLDFCIKLIDRLSGFDNIMSGEGAPGVRSGVQTDRMVKTASPQLRDRSLLVERQVATAADLRLSLMEAKDGRHYWTDPTKIDETKFLLSDLPEDRRVVVDSHSSSPIFADDHGQLVAYGQKAGIVDGESAIEMLPYPQKDLLIQRYKDRQAQQAKTLEQLKAIDPDAYARAITGRRR